MHPNNLQIFHFCCIHGNEKEKSKPCCRTLFEVKLNGRNNEENNCKADAIVQNYYATD
jgi:hypothetical protein